MQSLISYKFLILFPAVRFAINNFRFYALSLFTGSDE